MTTELLVANIVNVIREIVHVSTARFVTVSNWSRSSSSSHHHLFYLQIKVFVNVENVNVLKVILVKNVNVQQIKHNVSNDLKMVNWVNYVMDMVIVLVTNVNVKLTLAVKGWVCQMDVSTTHWYLMLVSRFPLWKCSFTNMR